MMDIFLIPANRLVSLLFVLLFMVVATSQAASNLQVTLSGHTWNVNSIFTQDVCIIGGGSSGTYAAIRLMQLGKSVMVVEQKDQLGGHTQTYRDPASGTMVDYGVLTWHNMPIVRTYCASLNVSLIYQGADKTTVQYFDFDTGLPDPSYATLDSQDFYNNLTAYTNLFGPADPYPYLETGFDLPSPVPSDLLMPFGAFMVKQNLQGLTPFVLGFSQGLGDVLNQPAIYVLKNFGLHAAYDQLAIIFGNGPLTTALHDNHLLYNNAATALGKNVLFNTTVLAVDRSNSTQVKVVVGTPSGNTLLECQKLVMAIPPKLSNPQGWDLSVLEISLFGQFLNTNYYAGLVSNSGIPNNVTIVNVNPNTSYNSPAQPATYKISQTIDPGLVLVTFGTNETISDQEIQNQILAEIRQLQVVGKSPPSSGPKFVAFANHGPYELTVPVTAIANGFYQELYGLQGNRNTWYTGAAWHAQDSSLLWQFTEALLPAITST
jgi:hypothetical protein